jgi:hypothetical protein
VEEATKKKETTVSPVTDEYGGSETEEKTEVKTITKQVEIKFETFDTSAKRVIEPAPFRKDRLNKKFDYYGETETKARIAQQQ